MKTERKPKRSQTKGVGIMLTYGKMKKLFLIKSLLVVCLCVFLASCSGTNNSKQSKASSVGQNELSEEDIQDLLFDGYKAQSVLQTEEDNENPVVNALRISILSAYSFYVDKDKISQMIKDEKIEKLNINPDEFVEISKPDHGKVFTFEDIENKLYFLYMQFDGEEQPGFLFTLEKEIFDSSVIQDMKNELKDSSSDEEKMARVFSVLLTNKNLVEYYAMKNIKTPSGKTKRIIVECVSDDIAE